MVVFVLYSTDWFNVHKKAHALLITFILENFEHTILNIGSFGLHTVDGSFKSGFIKLDYFYVVECSIYRLHIIYLIMYQPGDLIALRAGCKIFSKIFFASSTKYGFKILKLFKGLLTFFHQLKNTL